jgi:predicted phage terminase large subunit-like protein
VNLGRLKPEQLIAVANAARAESARRHLRVFVRQAWHVVEPAMPLMDGWHLDAICDHLQAVTRDEIDRLLITIPPGHAKSLLVSVLWPAWVWVSHPAERSLFGSYSMDLAVRDSVRCRDLIESAWYRTTFAPAWALKDDSNAKDWFSNTASGFRVSLSVGGQSTGLRGNLVVVDDPLNVKRASSAIEREAAIRWWDIAMSSRFNDMRRQRRVIIMQRLHDRDLAGHVLEQGGYEHLNLPTRFEAKRRCVTYVRKPDGTRQELFRDPRTTENELLFPSLFTEAVVAQAEKDLRGDFFGQHQQRPLPATGGMFQKAWWRFWKPDGVASDETAPRPDGCYTGPARAVPSAFDKVVISLDANFKGVQAKGNDPIVFVVVGCKGADRFVLDRVRLFVGFPDTITAFRMLVQKWPKARKKLVEAKANGDAIIETLKSEIGGIVPVEPEGGKEARAAAVSPQVQSGNVYLPDGAPWLDEWVDEFASFPKGAHDDQVDALSQALIDLLGDTGAARFRALAAR